MEFGVLAVWFASLVSYVSSPAQGLLKDPINKQLGWSLFTALMFVSFYVFIQHFSLSISLLMSLACLMLMWISIVLLTAHLRIKLLPFLIGGSFFVILLVQLGG